MWVDDVPNAAREAQEAKTARLAELQGKPGRTIMETIELDQLKADKAQMFRDYHDAMIARRAEPFWSWGMVGVVAYMVGLPVLALLGLWFS